MARRTGSGSTREDRSWPPGAWLALGATVGVLASMLLVHGYVYGLRDQALVIPMLVWHGDGHAFPHDPIVGTFGTYYTLWWWLLARLLPSTPDALPVVFFGAYVGVLWALLWVVGRLGWHARGRVRAGLFAQGLACLAPWSLAGIGLVEPDLVTRMIALPLLGAATLAALRGRWGWAGGWAGLAFDVHALSTVHWLGLMAAAALVGVRPRSRPALARGVGALVVVAAPVLAWRLLVPPTGGPWVADPLWLQVVALRSSHHVFPSAWDAREYLRAAVFVACYLLSRGAVLPRSRCLFDAWAGGVVAWALVGWVFVELVPVPAVIMLQAWRAGVFLLLAGIICAGAGLAAGEAGPGAGEAGPGAGGFRALVAAALLVVLFHLDHDGPGPAALVGAGLLAWWAWARRAPGGGRLRTACLVAIALAPGVHPLPRCSVGNAQEPGWLDVQRWARRSTPLDAVFIVPPWQWGFRVESRRSIYGSYKDGTLANFDARFAHVWVDRMRSLGIAIDLAGWGAAGGGFESLADPSLHAAYAGRSRASWAAVAAGVAGDGPVYLVTCPPAPGRSMLYQSATCGVEQLRPVRSPPTRCRSGDCRGSR